MFSLACAAPSNHDPGLAHVAVVVASARRPVPQPGVSNRKAEAIRISAFNVGSVIVVCGMTFDGVTLVVVGASLAVTAVVWHGTVLLSRMRHCLPS